MAPTLRIYKADGKPDGLWVGSFGGIAKPLRKLDLVAGRRFTNEWEVCVRGNKIMTVRIWFDETKPNSEGIKYEITGERWAEPVVWSNDDQPYNENAFEVSVPMSR